MASKLSILFAEVRRRKVLRSAVLYIAGGIAVIEGAGAVQPTFGFSQDAYDLVVFLVVLGFPAVLILSWFVEITSDGIRRTQGMLPEQLAELLPERWSRRTWGLSGLGVVAVLAGGYLVFAPEDSRTRGDPSQLDPGVLVVLPFKNLTGNPEFGYLGMVRDEIVDRVLKWERQLEEHRFRILARSSTERALAEIDPQPDTVNAIAGVIGAPVETVIHGSYSQGGDGIEFLCWISNAVTGEWPIMVRATESEVTMAASADTPFPLVSLLAERVLEALQGSPETPESRLLPPPPNRDARQAYMSGLESFLAGQYSEALPSYHRAHQLDTTFITPLIGAMEANSQLGRWAQVDSLIAMVAPKLADLSGLDRLRFEEFALRGGQSPR